MSIKKPTSEYLRSTHKSYTVLINNSSNLIQTTDAYAVWAYLQSKPTDWVVYKCEIQKRFTNLGRDKLSKALRHLKEIGLLITSFRRGKGGKMDGKEINILDEPAHRTTENQSIDRTTDFPTFGKPTSTNTINNININNITNKRNVFFAQSLFDYWKKVMNHPSAKLDDKRKRLLIGAYKAYGEQTCKSAILGCSKIPWNMGENPGLKRYDQLGLIFRNAEKVEYFAEHADKPSLNSPKANDMLKKLPKPSEAIQLCLRKTPDLHIIIQEAFSHACRAVGGKGEFGRLRENEAAKIFKIHYSNCAEKFLRGQLL